MEGHDLRGGEGVKEGEKGRETRRRARVLWLTIPQSSNVISVRILFPYSLCSSLPYFVLLSLSRFPVTTLPFILLLSSSCPFLPLLLFAIFNRVEPVRSPHSSLFFEFFSRLIHFIDYWTNILSNSFEILRIVNYKYQRNCEKIIIKNLFVKVFNGKVVVYEFGMLLVGKLYLDERAIIGNVSASLIFQKSINSRSRKLGVTLPDWKEASLCLKYTPGS